MVSPADQTSSQREDHTRAGRAIDQGNVVYHCCGTAGIIDYFLGLWAGTLEQQYLDFVRRVAEQTLGHASNLDSKGLRWYQAWTRTKPGIVTAETGYMIGAAGVGSAFLHLALAEQGRYDAILSPDNPFPAAVATLTRS